MGPTPLPRRSLSKLVRSSRSFSLSRPYDAYNSTAVEPGEKDGEVGGEGGKTGSLTKRALVHASAVIAPTLEESSPPVPPSLSSHTLPPPGDPTTATHVERSAAPAHHLTSVFLRLECRFAHRGRNDYDSACRSKDWRPRRRAPGGGGRRCRRGAERGKCQLGDHDGSKEGLLWLVGLSASFPSPSPFPRPPAISTSSRSCPSRRTDEVKA